MTDRYVFDSSIWIEIERKNSTILEVTQPLLSKNEVCLVDVILAEVLRGARSKKDFQKLKVAFSYFNQISTTWNLVAELAFQVGREGFYPPLIDLYIAQCVIQERKILITTDKHFSQIEKVQAFKMIKL